MDKARKEAMMDELKHYINGKIAELEKKIVTHNEKMSSGAKSLKKVIRERAVRE